MTKLEKTGFRDAIRRCVVELSASGQPFERREVTKLLWERYPEQVHEMMERLVEEAIGQITRQTMKEPLNTAAQQELPFPRDIAHLQVPRLISLPRDPQRLEGEAVPVWVPFRAVTLEQIDLHIEFLMVKWQEMAQNIATMRELRAYLAARLVGEQRLEPMEKVLEMLREME
jgi:hypothetical protein